MANVSSTNASEGAYWTRRAAEGEAQKRAELDEMRESAKRSADAMEENYIADMRGMEEDYKQNAETSREHNKEVHDKFVEASREREAEVRRNTYDRLGRYRTQDSADDIKRTNQAVAETEANTNRRIRNADGTNEKRFEETVRHIEGKMKESLETQKAAYAKDVEEVKRENRRMDEHMKSFGRTTADVRKEAFDKYEGEWNQKLKMATKQTEDAIDQSHRREKGLEANFERLVADVTLENDARLNRALSGQIKESAEERNLLVNDYERNIEEIDKNHKVTNQNLAKQLELNKEAASKTLTESLDNQAKTYGNALIKQRADFVEQLRVKEDAIQHVKTTDDVSEVSARAADKIREQVITQYDKMLQSEVGRNRMQEEAIKDEFYERFREIKDHADKKMAQVHLESLVNSKSETDRLQDQMEMELGRKDGIIKDTVVKNEDHKDRIYRKNAEEISRLIDKQAEELRLVQIEANNKIKMAERDNDFKVRTQQREFAMKMSDTIREYEKKLNDQKDIYETVLLDNKLEQEKLLREADRDKKQMLESLSKTYEHRQAEYQAQTKERERVVIQGYEDTIDKLKRNNANVVKSKG